MYVTYIDPKFQNNKSIAFTTEVKKEYIVYVAQYN